MSAYDEIYARLHDLNQLKALISQTEDHHLDCKVWPQRDDEAQRMLAKSLCGFANAEGGVIVIGLDARSTGKGEPDIIQAASPVSDMIAVKSRIESLVGELVEPHLRGVTVAVVAEPAGATAGFVLVCIPPTAGLPCRSRKDHRFYQRITSGTYPMEYFQIADMFGKRHRPQLALHTEMGRWRRDGQAYEREIVVGIENSGRAVARFPRLGFKAVPNINVNSWGIDGNGGFGLSRRPTKSDVVVFAGGADDVIHPGTILNITKLDQRAKPTDCAVGSAGGEQHFCFPEQTLVVELSADEVPSTTASAILPYLEIP